MPRNIVHGASLTSVIYFEKNDLARMRELMIWLECVCLRAS